METTSTENVQLRLNFGNVKIAAMTLRAINHKLRQQILRLIEENKQMIVTDIYVKLRMEQSVASQHLAILRKANVVIAEREGKNIIYSVNHHRMAEIAKFVSDIAVVKSGITFPRTQQELR